MGALVVEGRSDREFQVIDGQQRLATLSIVALATIAKLGAMAGGKVDPEANLQRATGLRSRFVGEKDPASLVETSKLFLNSTDDASYQDYLVQLRDPLNPRGLPKSNRLLWECFRYYRARLDEIADFQRNGERLAELLTETVGRQLMFILITVDDDLNAYTVFETLNARGLELSSTDLLKNYLFSRVKVATDLEVLSRRWRALIATVRQERFPEFLRYHLLCVHPKVRSERLFKLVRGDVQSPVQVFALMDALERRAELFSALSDPDHGYWLDRPFCRPFIRELNLFRVRQMTPVLFAAWEELLNEFERVLKLVSVVSFRYSVVSALNPNALEPVYHDAARALLDGVARSVGDVFSRLKPVYVDDAKFEQDFAQLAIGTNGQRRKLAKYILGRLEGDKSGRPCDPDTDPGSIEPILPENPSESWDEALPREHWASAIERIGNLTLLESSANRAVGNGTYAEKVAAYSSSAYALTREIVTLAPDDWTLSVLEKRQRQLASRAVHLWRADFV